MPHYRKCDYCGANLDPQESCDCKRKDGAALLQQKRPPAKHALDIISIGSPNVKDANYEKLRPQSRTMLMVDLRTTAGGVHA